MITPGHRRRLNRALHELRRPLQALLLAEAPLAAAGPAAGATRRGLLELLCGALAELDRELNGGPERASRRPICCRDLVLASIERWRPAAGDHGRIKVFWDAGPAVVEGDPVAMAQALDNLIANALEHGGPPLVVTGAEVAGRLRLTIANGSPGPGAASAPHDPGAGPAERARERGPRRRDPRRGHGIAVVSRVAADHRGRFALCRTGGGCVAALELPLADATLARAA